ncbi:MAG: hypothetical protein JNK16_14070 [Phycisphaerales bacterium]|nr:hypothetical protein [Phycisphaerales bacterium]
MLITFDDHAAMGNSPGAPIPEAARLSDFYLASHGVRFFSGSPFVAVVIHGANTPSGLQLIGGSTPDGRLTYQKSTPVEAAFFDSTGTIPFVVSAVSIRGDLQPISGTKTLEAYSVGGALLGADTQLDSSAAPLAVSAPGIHRIRVYSSSATVGFDDLRFDTPIAGMECPGDINGDSFVDDSDFSLFAVAYNILDCADPTMPPGCPADMNRDGYVDDIDFVIFLAQYNELLCP